MKINTAIENYKSYLIIEKRLTENSIEAYLSDIKKLAEHTASGGITTIEDITSEKIQNYVRNNSGKSLSRVMVFNIIKQLTQRAGIRESVSPNTFRHSFAAHLINRGTDLRTVQNMLGHESILTTEIYTRINKF